MKPTPRIRFIIRWEGEREIRVLQQWWQSAEVNTDTFEFQGEWRDVPLETA
jgi:hypothetical protein